MKNTLMPLYATLTFWLASGRRWVERHSTREQEEGSNVVEWIFIAAAVVIIAGIAIAAVSAFVAREAGKLG